MEEYQMPREKASFNPEDIRAADAKGKTLEEQIVEIVLKSHYIVLETLSRVIRPDIFVNVKHPKGTRVTRNFMAEVKRAAEELVALPNAQIGKLDPTDARNFLLNEDVFYSVEWVTGQMNEHDTLTIAGVIGLSLYDETQEFSALRYRQTGEIESVLRYQGIYERFCARNHQKVIDFNSLYHFLAHFMKTKAPYAVQLAESLENDQAIPERQKAKIVRKLYEGLAARFKYEPAVKKLRDIEEMPKRRARALQSMTPEERLLHSIFGE